MVVNKNFLDKNLGYSKSKKLNIGDVISFRYENKGGFWKVRKFVGICIKRSLKNFNERYTLRNVINGIPVELSFYKYSPIIIQLERLPINKVRKVKKGSLVLLRRKRLNESKVIV